ncbi:hypothetical protein [Mycolicibacterium sediminis]|uniref:Uncharacterized protein n=1 Tax=Mycolicibacterium sediminis TaxID=1286180 RepID=A0A7I7QP58_9MYCO|nr:hypothetical protein [Mycolicibacterium sediminis]BBY28101.1 hypothetical protein MSEDJ_21970 [Mycolicibacterium sediminis]
MSSEVLKINQTLQPDDGRERRLGLAMFDDLAGAKTYSGIRAWSAGRHSGATGKKALLVPE